jgi:endonuclease G
LKAPDQGFIVALPLNVSLRVEALTQQVEKVQPKVPAAAVEVVAKPPAGDVTLERFNFDLDYETRRGYDESFLGRGRKVPMPKIASGSAGLIAPLKSGSGKVLHYHHFSIMMHKDRRIPALSAGNVNYSATTNERDDRTRADFGSEQWKIDERMEDRFQLPSGFYDRQRRLDFGHLVRREDNCWGATPLDIEFANADTYHLTNCTPQHEDFNQASKRGIWGQLEADIAKQAARDRVITRMCIFAGPVFGDHDLICDDSRIGEVRIPLAFWKVIVAPTLAGRLAAYGFILDQSEPLENDKPFEDFTPTRFAPQHKTLAEIEARTFIRFDATLKAIDAQRP